MRVSSLLQALDSPDTKQTNRLYKINKAFTFTLKHNRAYSGLVNISRKHPMLRGSSGLYYRVDRG